METNPQYNVYPNATMGATVNPAMPHPDAIDEAFAHAANAVLCDAAELVRLLIGAHQSAVAVVVGGDWKSVRKYFSLSDKYAAWADYKTAAAGYGIHGWLLSHNQTVRLTQAELLAHTVRFTGLVAQTLGALWEVRNLRKAFEAQPQKEQS